MTTKEILTHHLRELAKSGISPETAWDAGIFSIDSTKDFLGLELGPAWVCPFPGLNEEDPVYQVKADNLRLDKKGKTIKYEWKKGAPLRVYVPSFIREKVMNPSLPIIITEGTKKALAANQNEFLCIALPGIDGWLLEGQPISEMLQIPWKNRLVFLCFDSDIMTKPEVQRALFRLERFLRLQGAVVRIMTLPELEGRKKTGLDDFLVWGEA